MNRPQRKRLRLPHYDYSQNGAYFCTICVHRSHKHKNLLASILNGEQYLNRFGGVVEECWNELPLHRPSVILDEFIVMPNHIHLVIFLDNPTRADAAGAERFKNQFGPQQSGALGLVIGGFKSAATRAIIALRQQPTVVWQTRFHDHVVRSDEELEAIRNYIQNNPARWSEDRCHPDHPNFESVWNHRNPDPIDFIHRAGGHQQADDEI